MCSPPRSSSRQGPLWRSAPIPRATTRCGGAPSARSAAAARSARPACRSSRTSSTSASTTAASGRRPTTARRGRRSSTTSRRSRSARSRSRRPTRTSSTSAAARGCSGPTSRSATASTSRPTRGRTWQHLGLRDARQIGADPRRSARSEPRCSSAVLGHPYGPNDERGVFRSTDGGSTWQRVLYKDENTGAIDLAFDPANAQTVYAVLWAARQGPWEIRQRVHGRDERPLQVDRRRHDVAAADARACRRRPTASAASASASRRAIRSGIYAWVDARAPPASTAPTTRARAGR